MRTYAESVGKPVTDWKKELQSLRGIQCSQQSAQWSNVMSKIVHWPTCACGVQSVLIPRDKYWGYRYPLDKELRKLGEQFTNAIYYFADIDLALNTLIKIERRAKFLVVKEVIKRILKNLYPF